LPGAALCSLTDPSRYACGPASKKIQEIIASAVRPSGLLND
jgi:hypothetical protein